MLQVQRHILRPGMRKQSILLHVEAVGGGPYQGLSSASFGAITNHYVREGSESTPVLFAVAPGALGLTHTPWGFLAVSATTEMPGAYKFDIADEALRPGARWVRLCMSAALGAAELIVVHIDLVRALAR